MKFYLTIFFCSFCAIAFSQFHIGVKAGIGLNDIYWNTTLASDNTDPLVSTHIGIFSKIRIYNKLSLIPELQYITKGYSTDGDPSVGIQDFKLKIGYLEVPVLINYQIIKWVGIEAGPSVGIKTGAKTVSDSGKSSFINDYLESVDFGVLGGLRFDITSKLSVIGRYSYGLSAVEKITFNSGPTTNSSVTYKAYNRSVQLSVAYQIR